MPRMQVYLPEGLYREVKEQGLPVSELVQEAARAELRRRALVAGADRYVEDLIAEVGEPSADETARAEVIARRIAARAVSQAS
jgi:hypothetical protein